MSTVAKLSGAWNTRAPIRVVLVEDDFSYRMFLRELIDTQADMQVVGESGNGAQVPRQVQDLAPDVVIMDLRMPGMDGLGAIRHMTANGMTANVIVVSAFADPEDLKDVLKAGVVTRIRKGGEDDPVWGEHLLSCVRGQAGTDTTPDATPPKTTRSKKSVATAPAPVAAGSGRIQAILVGGSTGSPQSLATVLSGLPVPLPVPVFAALHISEKLDAPLAAWLARESGQKVRIAKNGERIATVGGQVLIAPAGHHLVIEGGCLRLTDSGRQGEPIPSVNRLFASASRELGADVAAILLTGMGVDGAQGLLDLYAKGAVTVVQDEASCAVFGMPAEALRLGAAQRALPPEQIAAAVSRALKSP